MKSLTCTLFCILLSVLLVACAAPKRVASSLNSNQGIETGGGVSDSLPVVGGVAF